MTAPIVADVVTGERAGPFVVFHDEDGLRHAVRLSAILAVSDGDLDRATAAIQMSGNRVAVVRQPFDEVLGWFA